MRTLHVIDNLAIGGTQLLAMRTMSALQQHGVDVGLCVLTDHEQATVQKGLPDHLWRLGVHGDYRRPGSIRNWARRLKSVIDEYRPDIIHSWLWLSDVVSATAAARTGVPHVAHLVDRRTWLESAAWKHRYRRWYTRKVLNRSSSRFLAVSHAVSEHAVQYLRLMPERITVAWNSVEVSRFADAPPATAWGNSERPLILGIAARIEPEKGHQFLIEAMARLRDRQVSCELRITGDGTLKADLITEVSRLKLEDRVKFIGWVADVAQFLNEIDVFMVPSVDSEGLPTTILEAMASSRVVIATDVGGASEAIRNRRDGLLVRPADAQALVDAVLEVDANRAAAAEMGQRARQRVTEVFSSDAMMNTILKQYADILGTKVDN